MMDYETLQAAVIVLPKGAPIYSEAATTIKLEDECAVLFVVVEQERGETQVNKISIEPEEWPAIRAAVDAMVKVATARNAKGRKEA